MPVTQADRDAAASFLNSIEPVQWAGTHDPYTIPDDSRAVQAFMRHREAALDEAAAILRECEQTFRFYEQNHLAKKTQEGDEKAHRNKVMADKCAAFLALKDKSDD